MKIPEALYARVFDLATRLVELQWPADTRGHWALYEELRACCETAEAHPFPWETLADFTTDDGAALPLYQHALSLAQGEDAAGYRASIQFAMAQRYEQMGEMALALQYTADAARQAKLAGDTELEKEAEAFSRTLASGA